MLKKGFLFENDINQILLKQLKLCSVMCFFIVACMLLSNFKIALIFYGF